MCLYVINVLLCDVFTGAAGGIGGAVCDLFAREGARLAAVDINTKGLDEVMDRCQATGKP